MEKAKHVRRAAKGNLTRTLNAGNMLLEAKRPMQEIREVFEEVKAAHTDLVAKHEAYTMFLNDEDYTDAEAWMNECTRDFISFSMRVNDYTDDTTEQEEDVSEEDVSEEENEEENEEEKEEAQNLVSGGHGNENTSAKSAMMSSQMILKHEKPKLPTFYGDVRKYFIFREDFKHAVEKRCSVRDTIAILRSCLGPEPAKLIEGISSDLKAVWRYLDQNYGDPRVISDTVTADLERFKPIQPGEDHRFCDLVNLIRRSFNILKEVKRPQDIDNTHVISLIERKMTQDDLKVWARHINIQKLEPSMSNLLLWMEDEMTARLRSGAVIRKTGASSRSSVHMVGSNGQVNAKESSSPEKFDDQKSKPLTCYVCKGEHYVDRCSRFLAMVPGERWKVVKEQRACFSCLKRGKSHTSYTCSRRKACGKSRRDGTICKRPHHELLHETESVDALHVAFLQDSSKTILPVISSLTKGREGELVESNVFYDSGAQISLIRNAFADQLGLESKPIKIVITKVGGVEEELDTKLYKVPLYADNRKVIQTIQAVGIPQISEEPAGVDVNHMSKVLGIPEEKLHRKAGPVDVLIGINYPRFHVGETKVKDGLVARKSPLGWVIFGSNSDDALPEAKQVLHVRLAEPIDLTDFWKTESMGVSVSPCTCEAAKMSTEERAELKLIEDSCELQRNKWIMKYPWKRDPSCLPDNYVQVLKKLESTERRLMKQPDHANSYNMQIKEMEEMKFSRKLTEQEKREWKGPVHYVAHHAVLRPEKKSTPIRIVFNSSASFKGHTLNDYWFKGPDLLNNLFGVVLRFRENAVAVCGDITKMYHMVAIPPVDQHVHRFLWRNFETGREPDTYVKTVLTFGDRPAPTMAITAMRKTAKLKQDDKPKAAEAIINNAYVDDICDSVNNENEAKSLISDVDEVLGAGGFQVKKWTSNAALNHKESSEVVVLGGESHTEKVLGTVWLPKEDKFSFKIKIELASVKDQSTYVPVKLTKRQILSKLAGIFDPIGAGAAVLIKPKIAMQELWQLGLSWDDEVPQEVKRKWMTLFEEMIALNNVQFERCLTPPNASGNSSLVVFCDASRLAFGACAYARWKLSDGQFGARFVAAKSRVAPLKELTIPRLELQAAVVASRLGKSILQESRLNFEKVRYLSDSRVALAWIKGETRSFKPFVSCRVAEIQSNSSPEDWSHCPTLLNVADDLTKGISAAEANGRWFNGPKFLQLPEDHWLVEHGAPDVTEVNKERRKVQITCAAAVCQPVINCREFSTWRRLLRVTAYVLRFCRNLRLKSRRENDNNNVHVGPLSSNEIESAEEYWTKQAQAGLSERVSKGDFKTLSPLVDDTGIIRVGGRVDPHLFSYDGKCPVLLPHDHWISVLITRNAHRAGHLGVAATTAKIRRKYWIIKGTNVAKTIKQRCTFCREIEAKVEIQLMANLPRCRLQPWTPPFLYTSCDYFGPVKVKVGRNKTAKHYGVIFTCLNTRAVHCELATDLTTMEFLQVLRRFFSYRGYPKVLISDNGSQMVGAERELRLMIEGWEKNQLKEFCADRGMKWQFTTPDAPHQNGCSEAMVKTVKQSLKKAIGDTVLTPFELYTCLLEVANLVNQRPIGRIPNDPDDGAYLCPNDILLGRASSTVPQGPFRHTENPRHRFEFCQKIVDSFWKKWARDVLPHLVPRKKWNAERRNVAVNDFVILADSNAVRGKWSAGRILQVFPGEDGLVRNVQVKTASGTYMRPITKICVIYPAEGFGE